MAHAFPPIQKSAEAFHKLYGGKKILVKAGGAELAPHLLPLLAEQIRGLTRNDIHVTLVFGGGPQISAQWNAKHQEKRPMKNGVGITTTDVLRDGVQPAYEEVRGRLLAVLPEMRVLEPHQVHA
ncbi:MAG TPA: hypothetical protein VJK52_04615, partial [Candidatus Nanoarchaeia archaeon]|nr:hypothetical protein [Candidatus Nanoarchaeia archaeon]